MPPTVITIAIIGAGFSGTVIAVRLLRSKYPHPIHVVLINRIAPGAGAGASGTLAATTAQPANDNLGRGLAYGTKSDLHLLNVPCGRMSAFPEDDDDFLNFLSQRGVAAGSGDFVSRRWYGEYLRQLLDASASEAAQQSGNTFEMMNGEVTSLRWSKADASLISQNTQTSRTTQNATLQFSDGRTLQADRVVLALGNFAPANPVLKDGAGLVGSIAFMSPRYVSDPWATNALANIDTSKPVVLIGTGLTMFDIVLTLSAQDPNAKFIAVSRRGLLPRAHRRIDTQPPAQSTAHALAVGHTSAPHFDHAPKNILQNAATASIYVRAVRKKIAQYKKMGGDWRDVIASLRPITSQLWQRLPAIERGRLLRHVKPYWESHRHRAAPQIAAAIDALIGSGRLAVVSARILAIEPVNDVLKLTIQPRHQAEKTPRPTQTQTDTKTDTKTIFAATVINCTGPTSDYRIAHEALLLQLDADGMLHADVDRLGIAVNQQLQVLDRNGAVQPHLYCVGPLLKAKFWEATAVPELREHAKTAVEHMLASLEYS